MTTLWRRLGRAEAAVAGKGYAGPCGTCGGVHRGWRAEARRDLRATLDTPEANDARQSCTCACCADNWLAAASAAITAAVESGAP